jgi:hypothetical protein
MGVFMGVTVWYGLWFLTATVSICVCLPWVLIGFFTRFVGEVLECFGTLLIDSVDKFIKTTGKWRIYLWEKAHEKL